MAKANDPKARVPAIEATINMPEGWDSETSDERAKAWTTTQFPFGTLHLTFEHGKVIDVDAIRLSPEVIGQALMHGLKQKLVDAAAISRDTETGKAATIETKYNAVADVAARLLAGEWNKRREGGPTGGLLKRALIELYDGRKTAEQIQSFLDAKSDKEKAALRKNPKVAEIIERMRKEDAVANGEEPGKDLLAELDAELEGELEGDDTPESDTDTPPDDESSR